MNIWIESIEDKLEQLWISCPNCSVSFKEVILLNGNYSETKLCNYCKSLCEYCEDKKSLPNSNLCQKCQLIIDAKDSCNSITILDEETYYSNNMVVDSQQSRLNDKNITGSQLSQNDSSKIKILPLHLVLLVVI